MSTFRLTVAYDGGAYSGWQFQDNGPSIQAEIEKALLRVTGETIRIAGSGRTDAGVHALGQVASFDSQTELPVASLKAALNTELPRDIAIKSIEIAAPGFHAQHWAKRKRYRYVLNDGKPGDPFMRAYSWHIYKRLDVEGMHEAAQSLVGQHDFKSFQTGGESRKTTVRNVYELSVKRVSPDVVHLEIEADGFLYNMVRAITGTLVRVGRRNRPATWPAEVLAARHRCAAGITAPAKGLFLVSVDY